ncbi:hypothetical protein L209DRAFT_525849 [Thermothelomyces heterothallicus CBS 203.75]
MDSTRGKGRRGGGKREEGLSEREGYGVGVVWGREIRTRERLEDLRTNYILDSSFLLHWYLRLPLSLLFFFFLSLVSRPLSSSSSLSP